MGLLSRTRRWLHPFIKINPYIRALYAWSPLSCRGLWKKKKFEQLNELDVALIMIHPAWELISYLSHSLTQAHSFFFLSHCLSHLLLSLSLSLSLCHTHLSRTRSLLEWIHNGFKTPYFTAQINCTLFCVNGCWSSQAGVHSSIYFSLSLLACQPVYT